MNSVDWTVKFGDGEKGGMFMEDLPLIWRIFGHIWARYSRLVDMGSQFVSPSSLEVNLCNLNY